MQDPALISFEHDGFVARFDPGKRFPLAMMAVGFFMVPFLFALALTESGVLFLLGLFLGSAVIAFAIRREMAGWVLEGRQGHLRISRQGGELLELPTDAIVVRVELKRTPAAGIDGTLRTLVIEAPNRTFRMNATRWSTEELHGLAELIRAMEPGTVPEPPAALRQLQRQ